MNYGRSIADWQQYSGLPSGDSDPNTRQQAQHQQQQQPVNVQQQQQQQGPSSVANGPTYASLNGLQSKAQQQSQQQAPNHGDYYSRPGSNSHVQAGSPLAQQQQQQQVHHHVQGTYGAPSMGPSPVLDEQARLAGMGDDMQQQQQQRVVQMSLSSPPQSARGMNGPTMGVLGPLMGTGAPPPPPMVPTPRQAYPGCKGSCCQPPPPPHNMGYRWDKVGSYQPPSSSSYREASAPSSYATLDSRSSRYRGDVYRKDSLGYPLDQQQQPTLAAQQQQQQQQQQSSRRHHKSSQQQQQQSPSSRGYQQQGPLVPGYPPPPLPGYGYPPEYQKYYASRPPPSAVPPPAMLKYESSLHDKYKQPPPQYHQPGPNGALVHNGAVMGLQNPAAGPMPPGLGPAAYFGAQLATRGELGSDYAPDAKEPVSPMSLQQSKQAYMQKLAMQRLSVESHLREYSSRVPGYKNHREYQEYLMRHREIVRLQQSFEYTGSLVGAQNQAQNPLQHHHQQQQQQQQANSSQGMTPINLQFDQNGILINSSLMTPYGPTAVQQPGIVMPNPLSPGKDAPPNPYDAKAMQAMEHTMSQQHHQQQQQQHQQQQAHPMMQLSPEQHQTHPHYLAPDYHNPAAQYHPHLHHHQAHLQHHHQQAVHLQQQQLNHQAHQAQLHHQQQQQQQHQLQHQQQHQRLEDEAEEQRKSASKDFADKPNLDVRQFFASWDETEEEDGAQSVILAEGSAPIVVLEYGGSLDQLPPDGSICLQKDPSCLDGASSREAASAPTAAPPPTTTTTTNGSLADDERSPIIETVASPEADEVPTIHIADSIDDPAAALVKGAFHSVDSADMRSIEELVNKSADEAHTRIDTAQTLLPRSPAATPAIPAPISNEKTIEESAIGPQATDPVQRPATPGRDSPNDELRPATESTTSKSDDSQRFPGEDARCGNDELSLPELPTSECTPMSTTLNTPSHSDNEESSEATKANPSTSTNKKESGTTEASCEIDPASPGMSFVNSPLKFRKGEESGVVAADDNDDEIGFDFTEAEQRQDKADDFAADVQLHDTEDQAQKEDAATSSSEDANQQRDSLELDSTDFGFTEFSNSSSMRLDEESKMLVPPMEGNCLTKIVKYTPPVTDLRVLDSDEDLAEKVNDIWMGITNLEASSLANSSNNRVVSSEEKQVQTDRLRKIRKSSLRHFRKNKSGSGLAIDQLVPPAQTTEAPIHLDQGAVDNKDSAAEKHVESALDRSMEEIPDQSKSEETRDSDEQDIAQKEVLNLTVASGESVCEDGQVDSADPGCKSDDRSSETVCGMMEESNNENPEQNLQDALHELIEVTEEQNKVVASVEKAIQYQGHGPMLVNRETGEKELPTSTNSQLTVFANYQRAIECSVEEDEPVPDAVEDRSVEQPIDTASQVDKDQTVREEDENLIEPPSEEVKAPQTAEIVDIADRILIDQVSKCTKPSDANRGCRRSLDSVWQCVKPEKLKKRAKSVEFNRDADQNQTELLKEFKSLKRKRSIGQIQDEIEMLKSSIVELRNMNNSISDVVLKNKSPPGNSDSPNSNEEHKGTPVPILPETKSRKNSKSIFAAVVDESLGKPVEKLSESIRNCVDSDIKIQLPSMNLQISDKQENCCERSSSSASEGIKIEINVSRVESQHSRDTQIISKSNQQLNISVPPDSPINCKVNCTTSVSPSEEVKCRSSTPLEKVIDKAAPPAEDGCSNQELSPPDRNIESHQEVDSSGEAIIISVDDKNREAGDPKCLSTPDVTDKSCVKGVEIKTESLEEVVLKEEDYDSIIRSFEDFHENAVQENKNDSVPPTEFEEPQVSLPLNNSVSSCSKDFDFDSYDFEPFKNKSNDQQSGSLSPHDGNYRRKTCGYLNPLFHLDELENLNAVPVYTTKDGKITYSPNPSYTYRALIIEARQREGHILFKDYYDDKLERRNRRYSSSRSRDSCSRYDGGRMRRSSYRKHSYESNRLKSNEDSVGFEDPVEENIPKAKRDLDSEFEEIKPSTHDETSCKSEIDVVFNVTRNRPSLDGRTRKNSKNDFESDEIPNTSSRKLFFDISLPSAVSLPNDCESKSSMATEAKPERSRNSSTSEKNVKRCIFDLQNLKEDVLKKLNDLEARVSETAPQETHCNQPDKNEGQSDISGELDQCVKSCARESDMTCDTSEKKKCVEKDNDVDSTFVFEPVSEVCVASDPDRTKQINTENALEEASESNLSDFKALQGKAVDSPGNETVVSSTPTEMDMDSFVDDLLESCSYIQKIKKATNTSGIPKLASPRNPTMPSYDMDQSPNLKNDGEVMATKPSNSTVDNTVGYNDDSHDNECNTVLSNEGETKIHNFNGGIYGSSGRFDHSEIVRKTITALECLERKENIGNAIDAPQPEQYEFEPIHAAKARRISLGDKEFILPNGHDVDSPQAVKISGVQSTVDYSGFSNNDPDPNSTKSTDGYIPANSSEMGKSFSGKTVDNVRKSLDESGYKIQNGIEHNASQDGHDVDSRGVKTRMDALPSSGCLANSVNSCEGEQLSECDEVCFINSIRKSSAPTAEDSKSKNVHAVRTGRTERILSLPCSIDKTSFSFEICEQFISREKLYSSQSDSVVKTIPKLVIRKSDTNPKFFAKSKSVDSNSLGDVQKNAHDGLIKSNSTHPKIPKMIIRNVKSRPVTPSLDDHAENTCSSTNENEPKSLKVKIKLDEKVLDHVGTKYFNSNEAAEAKIPKMKIKLEEKLPRVVIQSDEANSVEQQKTIPKMKITNVKGNVPKILEKQSLAREGDKLDGKSTHGDNDGLRVKEKSKCKSKRDSAGYNSPSDSSHKRHSSSSSSHSKKIRRSPREDLHLDPSIEDPQLSPDSDGKQKSANSSCGSAASKIPKVIIKRASPSAEFKCELSKEAIVNAQPQVVLTRLKKLDCMAQGIKPADLEVTDTSCITEDRIEDKLESNELQWKSFIRGLKRRRELSRSSSTSDLSRLSSPKVKRRRTSDYALDCQDSDSGTRLTFPAQSRSNDDEGAHDEVPPATANADLEPHSFASAKAYWRSLDENMNSRGKSGYEETPPDEPASRPDSGEPSLLEDPSTATTSVEDTQEAVVPGEEAREESGEASRVELLLLLDKDVDVHEEEVDGTLDQASVIKVDTSDESQTTIDILPASPEQTEQTREVPGGAESPALEQARSNSADGQPMEILTEDAMPMHFEYELEVGGSQDDDSLVVPLPMDEVDGSSGSDGPKQIAGILIGEELAVIEDDLSGNTMVEEPMQTDPPVDPEPPPASPQPNSTIETSTPNPETTIVEDQPPVEKPAERVVEEAPVNESSNTGDDAVLEAATATNSQVVAEEEVVTVLPEATSSSKNESAEESCSSLGLAMGGCSSSDLLAKEVLAAKETLRKCLGSLSGLANGPTTRSRLKEKRRLLDSARAKLAKGKIKSSSIKHHREEKRHEKSSSSKRSEDRPRQSASERSSSSARQNSQQHSGTTSNGVEPKSSSAAERRPSTSSKETKSTSTSKAKTGSSNNSAKVAEGRGTCPTRRSSRRKHADNGSSGAKANSSTTASTTPTSVSANSKAERRLRSLTDEQTANVIANIGSLRLKPGKRPVAEVGASAEAQPDAGDEPAKPKALRACPEMGISKIVRELVFHDKATIRHRRYCMLCERWFPSTLRHRRHLAGYQHRHTELSQRRAIHMLFLLFTGKLCPKLLPPTVVRTDCVPGELTPLQIAVQDFAMVFDGIQQAAAKQDEDKDS